LSVAVLDNPFWSALTTEQESFAMGSGGVRWFPADVAPFCAVARAGQAIGPDVLKAALRGSPTRYFVGVLPLVPSGFHTSRPITLLQMTCTAAGPSGGHDAGLLDLGPDDAAAMLALTTLVFPGFFRSRTSDLGRYVGITREGELVAMGGERLAMPGYREISAICTLPAHTGRGYARTIVRHLTARILAEGRLPFLHVRDTNARARRLYESAGFSVVNSVSLVRVNLNPER
jgi:ribosomal protein S18 acetylase RimI-like enzyme